MKAKLWLLAGLIACVLSAVGGAVLAAPPLAVLKSFKNAETYQYQNIGTFDEDFQTFKRTLEAANLRYDVLSDNDLTPSRLAAYKVLMLPLLVDLRPEGMEAIKQYIQSGGKILATDGGGMPTESAAAVQALAGAKTNGHTTIQGTEQLSWQRVKQAVFAREFAIGTLVADVTTSDDSAAVAKWQDTTGGAQGAAMSRVGGSMFLGWAPGLQGETETNVTILTMALDDLSPGLSQQATAHFSDKEYRKYQEDLEALRKRTEDAIATARQADLAVPLKVVQKHYDLALTHSKSFSDYYQQGKFFEADGELGAARNEFSLAYAQAMPVRLVEARSIWLDRGTIVACQNAQGMSNLFDRLKRAGINVVYFETNNAGFTMYPSKISTQNPQTKGWDPLGTAVQEAHRRGMEIHAWFWTFNVGNTFHNPIIKEDADYPGPVLSSSDFALALTSAKGALIPPKQHEFWLDPSAPEARRFIKSLALEIVKSYDLDGLQLDYIRYPFNGKGGEMGLNWASRIRFERESRLSLDRFDEKTRQAFINWKQKQVSSFVQDVSATVRSAKPGIRISAAVYAMPRNNRIDQIQQDWENWVANGWVDTLNPMTYVVKGAELNKMAGYVRQSTENKAMVYPGLFIKDLDTAGLVEQLDISRSIGTLGNTMFAVAQLDEKKSGMLQLGPYRRPPVMTPQSDPLRAATLIFDGFAKSIGRYVQDPERPIISDRALTNEVLAQIDSIQRQLHSMQSGRSTGTQIIALSAQIGSLDKSVRDWLSLESFVKRDPRARYITSYLAQATSLLSYAAHKANTQSGGGAKNTIGTGASSTPVANPAVLMR